LKAFLSKHWFFIGIAVVSLAAFLFPAVGPVVKKYKILNIGIFLAFLITGLTLDTRTIMDQLKNIRVLLAALISSLFLIPLFTWMTARLVFPDMPDFIIGATIIAAAPVTIASGTVMTAMALGNVTLSLFICVLCNFAALITMPFMLSFLLRFGHPIDLPVFAILNSLIITVLAPTVIGQMLQPKLRHLLGSCKQMFSIFSQCVVLLIIYNAVSASSDRITEAGVTILVLLAFMALLHTMILVFNFGISRLIRLDRPSTSAFTIHTSQKTLTVSYVVWSGYFAAAFPLAMLPGIVYHLIQMIMDTFVAGIFRRQAEKNARVPRASADN
jgi:solute carrier family 10 (sodium/bile acid cotransporter), member 7